MQSYNMNIMHTGWRRLIGCLKLQATFRQRATKYRARLRKITCKDKASYDTTPPYNVHVITRHVASIYIHKNMYAYTQTHTRTHTYMQTQSLSHTRPYTHAYTHAHTHTHTHPCTHARTLSCSHTRTHTLSHTQMRMHTQTHTLSLSHTHSHTR